MKYLKDFPLKKALFLCAIVSIPFILFSYLTSKPIASRMIYIDNSYSIVYILVKSITIGLSNSFIYTSLFIYLRKSFSNNMWLSGLTYGFFIWLIRYGVGFIPNLLDCFIEIIAPTNPLQSMFSFTTYETINPYSIFLWNFLPVFLYLFIGIMISFLYNKFKGKN